MCPATCHSNSAYGVGNSGIDTDAEVVRGKCDPDKKRKEYGNAPK